METLLLEFKLLSILKFAFYREFLDVQAALKELRNNQHSKRAERDKCVKAIAAIRKEEESIRSEINQSRADERQLKEG